jgi:class 3 adenylate cyclase
MEPQFPAVRGAVHWGDVVYQEGGYVGSALNIASRVATDAAPHQIVVTAEVRQEVGGLSDVWFVPIGRPSDVDGDGRAGSASYGARDSNAHLSAG